ncbi:glycosyltransferase family 4 protein [Marinobacter changyiensis]|uniref:glycosyltransferase family 4 protein n=1 Tax=Marinobacter changyiensis TaxID=2604091 RepID=UPI0012641CAF|nr:glycosyltransferase family 4 protein [Marinobacter changyiensis]
MKSDITVLSFISSPSGGGAELLVRELHKIYKSKGFSSRVFYFNGILRDLDSDEQIMGVRTRDPLNIFRIRREIKKELLFVDKKLIVHAHLTWPFFYVALASLGLKNVIFIYTEHNTTNRRRRVPFLKYLERFFYSRYSRIICISEGVFSSLASWVGNILQKRLTIVPNGSRIFSFRSRPALKGRLPRLVSVGSLTYKKNFITLIRALSYVTDEFERYIIVGEGPERLRLEKLVREFDLEGKVSLVGWSDSIETYLQDADIQLIPSLWEGFGLVAVEGMSTGLPIVASNLDGLREVLDPSSISVELVDNFEDPEAWNAAIRRLIVRAEEKGLAVLASSARNQAEKFNMDTMASGYLNVYQELLYQKSS